MGGPFSLTERPPFSRSRACPPGLPWGGDHTRLLDRTASLVDVCYGILFVRMWSNRVSDPDEAQWRKEMIWPRTQT